MAVTVKTSGVLKNLFGGRAEVQAEGQTVGEIMEYLGVRERLCDPSGQLRRHFNIHVNDGEDIRLLEGLATPVKEGDKVTILSAIAGGRER